MTYDDIAKKIAQMTPEQRQCNPAVLLLNTDETMPVLDFVTTWKVGPADRQAMGIDQVDGVLDDEHPFLTIDF